MNRVKIIFYIMILTLVMSVDIMAEEIETTPYIQESVSAEESTIETASVEHTVTFIDKYNNKEINLMVKDGECVEEYIPKLPDNVMYCGWKINENDTTYFDFSNPVTSDLKLLLAWMDANVDIKYSYRVVFDYCYDNISEIKYIDTYSKIALIPEPDLSGREGYRFLGWYTQENGGKKWKFTEKTIDGGITLYAHWQYIGTSNNDNISPKTGNEIWNIFIMFILSLGITAFSRMRIIKISRK